MSQEHSDETIRWDIPDDEMFTEPTPGYQRKVDPPVIPLLPGQEMPPSPSAVRTQRPSTQQTDGLHNSALLGPNHLATASYPQQAATYMSPASAPQTASSQPTPAPPDDLPIEIRNLVNIINSLPKNPDGLPLKIALKSHRDLRGEIQSGSGLLKVYSSQLRLYIGDERVFSRKMWRWLTDPEYFRGHPHPDDEE